MSSYMGLYSDAVLLRRQWFNATSTTGATLYNGVPVPTGAKCGILHGVGAGGWRTNANNPGGGAAYARKKLIDLTASELFNIQVGSTRGSLDAGNSSGDSLITRVASTTVVLKAARGTGVLFSGNVGGVNINNGGIPGLDTDCIGDVRVSGKHGNTNGYEGGFSGGDQQLANSLVFG